MKISPSRSYAALLFLFLFLISATTAMAQTSGTVAQVVARVNQERLARGLVPYALNAQLTAAAQMQANDMSRTGKYGHTGSDGSTVVERSARAGYRAYSWGRRVGENYAVYHDVSEAMSFWMNSRVHRENILHPVYREMGVGIAPGQWGATIYVLNFGSQPDVLPIFINNGAAQTSSLNVTLTLSDEDTSDGNSNHIFHATQVQISNDADFDGAAWQPFAVRVPWSLPPGGGIKSVYIKYRDIRGHIVVSSDSIAVGTTAAGAPNSAQITLVPTATSTIKPNPSATSTRRPTATSTRTPRPPATRTPTWVPSPADEPLPVESATPAVEALLLPEPTESPSSKMVPLVYYNVQTPVRPVANVSAPVLQSNAFDPLATGIAAAATMLAILAIVRYMAAHPPI